MEKNKGNKGVEKMPKEKFDQGQKPGFQPDKGGDKGQQPKEGWQKAPAGGPRERSDEETIGRPVQLDEQGEGGQSGEKRCG
ncbi:MAG TPA: hypothetical protein VML54_15690 [Candidatus Limnocylindrales bacterium]|nr:hypothetical protein [Candidatus Limnocylindrales bacterium]